MGDIFKEWSEKKTENKKTQFFLITYFKKRSDKNPKGCIERRPFCPTES